MTVGTRRLIGKQCNVEFNIPSTQWPFPGFPAHVTVVDVDMPLVLMRGWFDKTEKWINAADIKNITEREQFS